MSEPIELGILFMDGFDHYLDVKDKWGGPHAGCTGSIIVDPFTARTGNNCLKLEVGQLLQRITYPVSSPQPHEPITSGPMFGFAYRTFAQYDESIVNKTLVFMKSTFQDEPFLRLGYGPPGGYWLQVQELGDDPADPVPYIGPDLNDGEWHYFEIGWHSVWYNEQVSSATQALYLAIDGNILVDYFVFQQVGLPVVGDTRILSLSYDPLHVTGNSFVDDLYIAGYPPVEGLNRQGTGGDFYIHTLFPNDIGYAADWPFGDTPHYAQVNQNPPQSATTVETDTTGLWELYKFDDIHPSIPLDTRVYAVQPNCWNTVFDHGAEVNFQSAARGSISSGLNLYDQSNQGNFSPANSASENRWVLPLNFGDIPPTVIVQGLGVVPYDVALINQTEFGYRVLNFDA